jgi:thiol-disulfide isomerase/thioredoxin
MENDLFSTGSVISAPRTTGTKNGQPPVFGAQAAKRGSVVTARLFALLAALVVSAAACGGGSKSQQAASPSVSGAHPSVPAQLQFTAKTLDGRQFSGESLLGKPAVLWFWAPWCPNCQREAPMVREVAAAHPTVTFVGVAARDQPPAMQQFVDKYKLNAFTQLADTDGAVWAKFRVMTQPAFAFVTANGGVDLVEARLSEPELTERVTALAPK